MKLSLGRSYPGYGKKTNIRKQHNMIESESVFELTPNKFSFIAKELGVNETQLDDLYNNHFKDFYETVRFQHLAHIIRAMEMIIRKKEENQSFRIEWKSMPEGYKIQSAISLKWPDKFGIVVPAKLVDEDLIKLRVHVAHELGHLFFITHYPEQKNDIELNHKMANVFGVFTLLERNKFYDKKARLMCHEKWEDVVEDFKQLDKQK